MDNFVPNSNKFKEEQKNKLVERKERKPISKVTKGKVKVKKKSELHKLADTFISEDAA